MVALSAARANFLDLGAFSGRFGSVSQLLAGRRVLTRTPGARDACPLPCQRRILAAMGALGLRRLVSLAASGLLLAASCAPDEESRGNDIIDLWADAVIEQIGNESDQTVKVTFRRQGKVARRPVSFAVWMYAEVSAPVERVAVGPLMAESAGDVFVADELENSNATGGQLELAPCAQDVECVSVFSSRVTTSASAPATVQVKLIGGAELPTELEVAENLAVDMAVAP
jgi:hypothetical protein